MYKAMEIAKYIITICNYRGDSISNLKLQKLLYYVQGRKLKLFDEPMFLEPVSAWKYGPVVREVYNYYSIYSSRPIEGVFETNICIEDMMLINDVIDEKIDIPVWDLVQQTHNEDPWKYIYSMFGNGAKIPNENIKQYFIANNA